MTRTPLKRQIYSDNVAGGRVCIIRTRSNELRFHEHVYALSAATNCWSWTDGRMDVCCNHVKAATEATDCAAHK